MSYLKDRDEFVAIMAVEGLPLEEIGRTMRLATRYHRIQEDYCNGPRNGDWTQEWQDSLEHREQVIEVGLTQRRAFYNITPVFQGDPRGATVKLKVPSGKTNDWASEGICVPTRT